MMTSEPLAAVLLFSALAAASVKSSGGSYVDAAQAARDNADSNLDAIDPATWPTCTDPDRPANYVVDGATRQYTGDCVSFDTAARLVRVVLPTTHAPGFFGRVVGDDSYDIGAQAAAFWGESSGGSGDCGICAIGGAWFQQDGKAFVREVSRGSVLVVENTTGAGPGREGERLVFAYERPVIFGGEPDPDASEPDATGEP